TAAEFEREERGLFDSAITRATLLTVLSYPEFDARGERNLPSLYLEHLLMAEETSRAVRPAPKRVVPERGPAEIRDRELLEWFERALLTFSPGGLEHFLQCPFQFFGMKTLRLRTAPDPPYERLSFLLSGEIVHEVLAKWWGTEQDVATVFEQIYARVLAEKHIPSGYHTERLRNEMLDSLLRFARTDSWPRVAFTSETEKKFELPITDRIQINGRIDRIDRGPDGRAYVIDYKYSRAANVKERLTNENLLQAPLYLLAAEEKFGVR